MFRFSKSISILLVAVCLNIQKSKAESIQIIATDDTRILKSSPNSNYGTQGFLRIGTGASATNDIYRSVIIFDLSGIPSNATITSAIESVWVSARSGAVTITVDQYRVTNPWLETQTTWNNRKTDTLWSSAGGDYDGTAIASQTFSSISVWKTFDITTQVQNWVDATHPNYGLIAINTADENELGNRYYDWHSAEGTNPARLFVVYTVTSTKKKGRLDELWEALR